MKFNSKLLHILVCLSIINLIACSVLPKVLSTAEINDIVTSKKRCGSALNKSIDNVCLATVGQITDIRSRMQRRQTRSTCKYNNYNYQSLTMITYCLITVYDILNSDTQPAEYDFGGDNQIEDNNIFSNKMFERKRRGVVDKCCYSPCTFETLIHFCPQKS